MAVTAFWYAPAIISLGNGLIDWANDAMKVALTTNTYTPNQDTHNYFDDITNEITDTGYTAGGATLGTKTLTNTNNVVTWDAANSQWTSGNPATLTARRAVVYNSTPATNATRPLMLWVDFGQDEVASNGGTFTIQWNASGIAAVTVADATGFP